LGRPGGEEEEEPGLTAVVSHLAQRLAALRRVYEKLWLMGGTIGVLEEEDILKLVGGLDDALGSLVI
jgi:hypothetical protein